MSTSTNTWPTVSPTDLAQESMATPPPTDRPTTTWPKSYTVPPTDRMQESMGTPPPTDRPTTTWPKSYTVPPTDLAQESMATPPPTDRPTTTWPKSYTVPPTDRVQEPMATPNTSEKKKNITTNIPGPSVYSPVGTITAKDSILPTPTSDRPTSTYTDRKGWVHTTLPAVSETSTSAPGIPMPAPATNRTINTSTKNRPVDHSAPSISAAMTVDMRSGTSTDPIVVDSPQSTPPGTSYSPEYSVRPHYGPYATPTEISTCETGPNVTSSSSIMETLMPSSTVATVTSFATPAARDGEVDVAQTPGLGAGMETVFTPAVVLGGLMVWKVFGGKKG